MFDLKVMELHQNLLKTLQESGMPMSVIVYVLKDVLGIAQSELQIAIKNQQEELNNKIEEK